MRSVDLFCGCGGMSLGFMQAGYDIQLSIDSWDKAVEVYSQNFKHEVIQMDLTDEKLAIDKILKVNPDLIVGGPPCQDFSSAGKRDETLGRADLTYSYANIVTAVKPTYFVMENVARIKNSAILLDIVNQFKQAGYGLTAVILDASFCGVPQARTRFFLIGHLDGQDNALIPYLEENLAQNPMTIRDYLGDSLGIDYYYRHPRSYARRGIFSVDEPSPTVRGVNRPVPPNYKKHAGDADSVVLNTLRPLTTIERSYLQTFPKSFIFEGAKTNLEQMIGNAVPVNLAQYVANALKRYDLSDKKGGEGEFSIPKTSLHRLVETNLKLI